MKLISLRCDNCGAELEVEENCTDLYCRYCGKHMIIDNEVKENIYRTVDEARILEAQVRLKELDQQEDLNYFLNKYRFSKLLCLMTIIPIFIYEICRIADPDSGTTLGTFIIIIYFVILRKRNIV